MGLSTAGAGLGGVSGRSIARLRPARPRWALFRDILGVGAVASVSTLQTTLTVALTTAVVARAGGPDAVAGYGTGARLEYLLIPLVFGLGAPLVALVGTNIGAGQTERALRIALTGGALAFVAAETVGLVAAVWPQAWLGLFGDDPRMLETGAAYLRGRRADLRLLRAGAVAVLRLPGGRTAVMAAVRRAAAAGRRGGRRLGGAAPDRLAGMGVRCPRGRAGRLRRDARRGDRLGRLVATAAALNRLPGFVDRGRAHRLRASLRPDHSDARAVAASAALSGRSVLRDLGAPPRRAVKLPSSPEARCTKVRISSLATCW